MNRPPRPIFRADAVRRYAESRQQAVLPHFIAPQAFLWLWLVAAVLIGGVALAWLTQVPVYLRGQAVVLDPKDGPTTMAEDAIALVVLPPEAIARLRIGQQLFAPAEPSSLPIRGSIIAVEPTILSPAAIQQRFAQTHGVALVADRPSAVALARLDLPPHVPATAYSGSRYQVSTEVGSRRVLAFLPVFGQLLGE